MTAENTAGRRLRVLQCITRLGLGGAERVAFAIMRQLRGEIDFAVFTVHDARDDAIGDAMGRELTVTHTPWFRGTAVPMKAGGMLPGGMALARAVRTFRPDVVHFHSETPEACGAAMVQFSRDGSRVALARTIHNSVFWRYWPRIGRWCDRRLAAAQVACVSEAARDEFLRYRLASGAAPSVPHTVVIYNGVDAPALPPHAAPHTAAIRRVLFAGRFEYQKGVDVLCRALPAVALPDGTSGELMFVGEGADEPLIRALAHQPPARWRVALQPPAANLAETFSRHDIVVMPSRFEGLGLVAIEATLAGLPVVASDAPGLREVLPPDHPWPAKVDDPDSLARAISHAMRDVSQWQPAVTAAQHFARSRFDPRKMADAYLAFYREHSRITDE